MCGCECECVCVFCVCETLEHKTSHKSTFFKIEMYASCMQYIQCIVGYFYKYSCLMTGVPLGCCLIHNSIQGSRARPNFSRLRLKKNLRAHLFDQPFEKRKKKYPRL